MKDQRKTKAQLIDELVQLRERVAELEEWATERARPEQRLPDTRDYLDRVVSSMHEGLMVISPEYEILDANSSFLEQYGATREETIGRTCHEVTHRSSKPCHQAGHPCPLKSVLETGAPVRAEHIHMDREGKEYLVELHAFPLLGEAGQVESVVETSLDITERKRAEESLTQRSNQLALISEVGQRITHILELHSLYQTVVETIREKLGYENVAIFSVQDAQVVMEAVAGPQDQLMPSGYSQIVGEGMVGWVAQTGEALLANDVTKEPQFLPLKYLEVGAELDVPIKLHGETVGVLTVDSVHPDVFTESDITTLETISEQVARAIENASLYDEQMQKAFQLEALRKTTLEITTQLNLHALLHSITSRAIELLRGASGGLYLYDSETEELELTVAKGPDEEFVGLRLSVGDGACGKVAQTREPLVVTDYANWEGKPPQFHHAESYNVLAVPIERGDTLLGALYVDDPSLDREFTEGDVGLVTLFANQAAIAIENARLYEAAREEIAERKRTEEALERAKNEWESTFHAMSDWVTVMDPETRQILRTNRVAEQIVGVPPGEIVGQTCCKLAHGSDEPLPGCPVPRMLDSRQRESVDLRVPDSDRWLMITVDPILDEAGKVVGAVHIVRDITERKRAQEEIRKLSEFREAIIENANVWLDVLDEKANVVAWNKAAEEISGYSREEVVGHGMIWEWLYPDEEYRNEVVAEAMAIIERGEEEQGSETTIRCKDGQTKIISWNTRNLLDETGNSIGSIALGRDITDHKRAEEALQRLMDFNEGIVQNMAEGIVIEDAEGHVTFANPTSATMLGYETEELVGQHWTAFTPPDQHEILQAADERRARGETDHYELQMVRKDGKRVPVLVSGSPRFEGGRFAGSLAVFTDITELKRAEAEIHRRNEELAALNAVASSVTSTLDLQEVMHIIQDRVQTLLGEKYPPIFGLYDEAEGTFELMMTGAGAKFLARAGKIMRVRFEELRFPLASMNPELRAALLAGKPYVTDDASDILGPRIGRKLVQAAHRALGVKCIVDAPLWVKGRLVGGMVLFSQRERIPDEQMELLSSIARHAAIAIDNARLYQAAGHEIAERQRAEAALRRSHQSLQTTLEQTVAALAAAVEVRDPYTAGHQLRTADLAAAIAEEMGLSERQIGGILMAGSIHDIGKIQVPAEILSKPTRLTEAEWSLIKAHPQAGYDILRGIDFPWPVARTVLEHHERTDGSGYPQGLSGNDIVLEARILAVADVVEAMASHRPYRPAHAIEEALEELQENRGILYDAAAVDACVAVIAAKKFQFYAE